MKAMLLTVSFLFVLTGCGAGASGSVQPATSSGTRGGEAPRPFQTNVLEEARKNDAYRRVLFTGARSQLVVMTIPVGGDIGLEAHDNVEQLIFIASGRGKAIVNDADKPLAPGDVLVATPGARHNVVNVGAEPLRIYTVYAPANHIDGRVHGKKADAEADQADEAFGAAVR